MLTIFLQHFTNEKHSKSRISNILTTPIPSFAEFCYIKVVFSTIFSVLIDDQYAVSFSNSLSVCNSFSQGELEHAGARQHHATRSNQG